MLRFVLSLAAVMLLAAAGAWVVRFKLMAPGEGEPPEVMSPEQTQEALPYKNLFSAGSTDMEKVQLRPYGDPMFAFSMMLPRKWNRQISDASQAQRAAEGRRPVLMAEMAPPNRNDVLLEVRYVPVPMNVTLDRFVDLFARQAGFHILARQRGDFNRRDVVDALLQKKTAKQVSYLTRLTASRRGEHVFVVAGSAVEAEYPRWKRVFGAAAVTFELLQK